MDIFLHIAGLAFIPLIIYLIISGLRDIFKLFDSPALFAQKRPFRSRCTILSFVDTELPPVAGRPRLSLRG